MMIINIVVDGKNKENSFWHNSLKNWIVFHIELRWNQFLSELKLIDKPLSACDSATFREYPGASFLEKRSKIYSYICDNVLHDWHMPEIIPSKKSWLCTHEKSLDYYSRNDASSQNSIVRNSVGFFSKMMLTQFPVYRFFPRFRDRV